MEVYKTTILRPLHKIIKVFASCFKLYYAFTWNMHTAEWNTFLERCRGGGRSQKLRRHGGYRLLGLVWRVGHSNGGAGPRRAEAGCVRGSPLPQRGSRGVIPGKILKLQMRNTAFWCIFSSVPVMYAHGWNPCALWLLGVRRKLPRKIGACGGLDLSLIHIWRCRRSTLCRSRWSPYH